MMSRLAWKNVWRNKRRSTVLIFAIGLGLWGGVFSSGIMYGMIDQAVKSAILSQLSDVQIHLPGFLENREFSATIPGSGGILDAIATQPFTRAVSRRMVIGGMVSSPTNSLGCTLYGIIPSREKEVTDISTLVIEGNYFQSSTRNPVLIGRKLADKLDVKTGSKLVLTFQGEGEDLIAGSFRVCGIYRTASSAFDEMSVFVQSADLESLVGAGYHEIAILLRHGADLSRVVPMLRRAYPNLNVQSWKELAPEMMYLSGVTEQSLYIFLVVIMLGLLFGITNTMLMSLMDRIREFGVLTAVGMQGNRLFLLLMEESLWVCAMGSAAGITAGALTIRHFARVGIDLSGFAQGLNAFGMGTTLYPSIPLSMYGILTLLVVLMALGASVYPGIRSIRLEPAKAIRTW